MATSTEIIKGTSLHAGLYVYGHDLMVMTRENNPKYFQMRQQAYCLPFGEKNGKEKH